MNFYPIYTLGYIFDYNEENVLLVLKNKPIFHKGMYNAVGGKIEDGESSDKCIHREAIEEVGMDVNWSHFANFTGNGWAMMLYYAHDDLLRAKMMEDMPISIFPINELPSNLVPNNRWLIPMALNHDGGSMIYEIKESETFLNDR